MNAEGQVVAARDRERPDAVTVLRGFDERLAGRRAECDGGGLVPGTRYATRHEFTGTLTGEYYVEGDPPWRWYLMHALTRTPSGYPFEAVWCESESLFLLDERAPGGPARGETSSERSGES